MMGMELPGKKRFLDIVKEDMGEVGAKKTDVEDRKVWRMIIRCVPPLTEGKGRKEKKRELFTFYMFARMALKLN